jgi:hypothetical protein
VKSEARSGTDSTEVIQLTVEKFKTFRLLKNGEGRGTKKSRPVEYSDIREGLDFL